MRRSKFCFIFQVKRDPNTNQSRGYGFIRFRDYDAQVMCLAERHFIDSRWCDVRIPISKVGCNESCSLIYLPLWSTCRPLFTLMFSSGHVYSWLVGIKRS